jgi:hypothetical protein
MSSSRPMEHQAWINGLLDATFSVTWDGPTISVDGVKKLVLSAVPDLRSVVYFDLLEGDKGDGSKLDPRAVVSEGATDFFVVVKAGVCACVAEAAAAVAVGLWGPRRAAERGDCGGGALHEGPAVGAAHCLAPRSSTRCLSAHSPCSPLLPFSRPVPALARSRRVKRAGRRGPLRRGQRGRGRQCG